MRKQFIVNTKKEEREEFFDYITSRYKLGIEYPFRKELFIASNFPFVVDFKEKIFWVCENITCCAIAQQQKVIITFDDFKLQEDINKDYHWFKKVKYKDK